jgi:hypothetical protein
MDGGGFNEVFFHFATRKQYWAPFRNKRITILFVSQEDVPFASFIYKVKVFLTDSKAQRVGRGIALHYCPRR